MRNPSHPSEVLREWMPENLTVTDAAEQLKVSRPTPRASWSSTRTTPRVRCTRWRFCSSWSIWHASISFCCSPTRSTAPSPTTSPWGLGPRTDPTAIALAPPCPSRKGDLSCASHSPACLALPLQCRRLCVDARQFNGLHRGVVLLRADLLAGIGLVIEARGAGQLQAVVRQDPV